MIEIDDERIDRMNAAIAAFAAGLARIGEAAREACEAICRLGAEYYAAAERAYLLEHRRLPGSTRSLRFMKKRRRRVLEWFEDAIAAGPQKV
jgi:hypothetical protein